MKGRFGSGSPTIAEALERAGYRPLAAPIGVVVKGRYGPLREGEPERARRWGEEPAAAMEHTAAEG